MKTLNIFTIILLIAFTNAIEKILFSDIVTSLVELSDDKENALSNVNTIAENFQNSNSLLTNLKTRITENCSILNENGTEKKNKLQAKIESYKSTIDKLTLENQEIATTIVSDESSVKSEVEKIKLAKAEIESVEKEVLNTEKSIIESINVLKRLRNLAIDELQGAIQKSTEMNQFNVTITTAPSFIQFSEFHGELKSFLSKADLVNRGLISTLILLTQNAGKLTYSNPKTVSKIISMIDKIIENFYNKVKVNQKLEQEKIKSYSDIVENSRTLIARLKDEIQRKISVKISNENEVAFYNNDIIFLQRAYSRREKRNDFNSNLCKEQSQLVDKHFHIYIDTINQVNELKSSLSIQ